MSDSYTATAQCIEWLDAIKATDANSILTAHDMHHIDAIRTRPQAAQEMAAALAYIKEATSGTKWARAAAPPLAKWVEATT